MLFYCGTVSGCPKVFTEILLIYYNIYDLFLGFRTGVEIECSFRFPKSLSRDGKEINVFCQESRYKNEINVC